MQLRGEVTRLISSIKNPFQELMRTKLDAKTNPNYLNFPSGVNQDQLISAMTDFIENKLDEFFTRLYSVISDLSFDDIYSMGTLHETSNTKKLTELFDFLEKNGFAGINAYQSNLIFWSGKQAEEKANQDKSAMSGKQTPALAVLLDCAHTLRAHKITIINPFLIFAAISRHYAKYAKGEIDVYFSSDKLSEAPGITAHNIFWTVELPMLQYLLHNKIVKDIRFHLYDQHTKSWQKPKSILNPEYLNLMVRRRCAHKDDPAAIKNRFFVENMEEKTIAQWRLSSPRPAISIGRLKFYATHWQQKAKHSATLKKLGQGSIEIEKSTPTYKHSK